MRVETRALTAEDIAGYADVGAASYNLPLAAMTQYIQEAAVRPMYGAFAGGHLAAALLDHRLDVRLNGAAIKASGIGMLASAPETRRRGVVREMLAGHLRQLREQGVVLSLLYPFAYSFYDRLGWAMVSRGVEIKVAPREFAAYGRRSGTVRRLLYSEKDVLKLADGQTLESVTRMLDGIHRAVTCQVNLASIRSADDWSRILKVIRGRRSVYSLEDERGCPQGYVITTVRAEEYPADLFVREIVARTPEAWRGLLFFLSCHDSNIRHIIVSLPVEHPLPDLLENPRAETSKLAPQAMARAVDVAGLLATRGTDGCTQGECLLSIRDGIAPWNEGTWRVGFDGRTISVGLVALDGSRPGSTDADLEMNVNSFTQLAVGYRPLAEMLQWGLVRGRPGPGAEFAASLFPARPVWHGEYY